MFYEYALDPAVLSSWERVRYFLDAFGPWKGRFLAEYPRRWRKLVYDGLRCNAVERTRIEERLRRLDERVFSRRPGSTFNGKRPWLDNAEAEHERSAFRAIIALETRGKDYILDGSVVDETEERWRVEQGCILPRDPLNFVHALGLLLRESSHVVMIDPYFRADQPDKTSPLTTLCQVFQTANVQIEIHGSEKDLAYAEVIRHAKRALPDAIPEEMKVLLRCWKERPGGARLHNRFLLTDIGGVQFGDSIERGEPSHEDRLAIVDEPSHKALWAQYVGSPAAFDEAGPPCQFTGRKRH